MGNSDGVYHLIRNEFKILHLEIQGRIHPTTYVELPLLLVEIQEFDPGL